MQLRSLSDAGSDPLGAIWELLKKLGSGVMHGLNAGNGFKEPPAWQGPELPPAVAFKRADDAMMEKLRHPPQAPQQRPSPFGVDTSAIEVPPPLKEDLLSSRVLR